MKSYAPKGLHSGMVRELMTDMGATPADLAKLLHVTERSVWRWLSDGSAPFAAVLALWHESPRGHYNMETDVGNHNNILRGLARAHEEACAKETARMARLLAVGEFGSANDPLMTGPAQVAPPYRYHRPAPGLRTAPDLLPVDLQVDFA